MGKCLYCYQPLIGDELDFHQACSKKMFETNVPPILDFNQQKIEELARQIVVKSIAITGVQPKLSLELEKKIKEIPRLTIVGLHGHYIFKPQSPQFQELPQNEDLTMHLAELVKIQVAKHSLIRLKSGELGYITKRFDRSKGKKIAVEDFCQLSENLTEHKYRGSVEKIGKLAHQFTTNKGFEAQRLFELVLFSFLTGNSDMHLKNYSLILNTFGEYEFSPAYDLLSTALVIIEDNEESALTINGKKNKIRLNDFNVFAKSLYINEKSAQSIYTRFIKVLPKWETFIKQSFLSEEIKENYINLISHKFDTLFPKT